MVEENDLQPEQVEKVRVGILRAGVTLIAEPAEKKYRPESIIDAQFSMPFGAAGAIIHRKAGLDEFQLSKIQSEEVKLMMAKIECFMDPDLDKTFPKQWNATAEILTRDSKRYFAKIEHPKGDPENSLSWKEVIEKFNDLNNHFLIKERRQKILDQGRRLERIQDFQKWSCLLLRNR